MASYIGSTGLTYLWNKIKAVFATKQDTLVSGTNIKTINSQSLLGSGDISISGAPAVIEMRVVQDGSTYNTPTFIDAGEAYDIVVANGANVIVRMERGYVDGNTTVYNGEYLYFPLLAYTTYDGDFYLAFYVGDLSDSFELYLANDYEGDSEELIVEGWQVKIEHESEEHVIQCVLNWSESTRYIFTNHYSAYYDYVEVGKDIKFILREGTRNAQNTFVPNGNDYPLEVTYVSDTGNTIVCSSYSSEKKYTFVLGVDHTNHQLTIDEINIEDPIETVKVNGSALTPDANKAVDITVPTESTVSGWGFTKNVGTITGINVAGVSKGTSGVVDVGISEVNHGTSDTTFTLTPNVMHIWGTVTSLTLSLPTDSNSYLDEFMFTFTSGSTPTTLSLPSTVKWVQDIEVEANKTYQVSIINNLAGWLTNGMPSGGGSGGEGENNVIESISVNGVTQTVSAKNVDLLFKTINNESISGTGNISISGGGGEANVIESISVNSVAQTVTNKNVNITVPTKVSDLTNDSGFTSNTGTITSVKMNGSTVSSSGEADLGTVITSETSLSKGSTSGSGNAVTDLSVSGHTITLTKGKTFLESESDPIFTASAAYSISSSDITNWNGKTSNVGTITGINMNGSSKGTSGVVDLGTVITSHQDISGKADKSEMSVVAGTGTDADKTTITLKSGTSATVLTAHQDISGKADSATTLAGYGITNAYTKTETQNNFFALTGQTGIEATSSSTKDLDTYTTPGSYFCYNTGHAYVSNAPTTATKGFRLWVYPVYNDMMQSTGIRYVQDYIEADSQKVYRRIQMLNGSASALYWSTWKLVQDDLSNKPNIYTGSSAPSSSTGSNGDIYIQTS